MKPLIERLPRSRPKKGFALVVTLTLLILLVMLATGLLTLSTISLRSSSQSEAQHKARTNARLAVLMAVAELQKSAGDDRRITADASILSTGGQPNMVGVWESWSADFAENPTKTISSSAYDSEKTDRFLRWLVSHPDPTVTENIDSASRAADSNGVEAFTRGADGFSLSATKVPVPTGAYAWAVSQEATRAKITVAGARSNNTDPNDVIQAQPRPNLTFSEQFQQPSGDWNTRSARVISLSQADLDSELTGGSARASTARADFTTQSMGLLTNVVNGGLKADMSLGFEMSENNFNNSQWDGLKNPFHIDGGPAMGAVGESYRGQRPLFRPITPTATHTARLDNFEAARVRFDYPGAGVPTFHLLRSFYRIPHHLYRTNDGVTTFERPADHIAFKSTSLPSGLYPTAWAPPPAVQTQTGLRPVLDRVMFLLSTGLTADSRPSLVITPVVIMWNPYNVALEIEGAVAYTWLDVPFGFDYLVYNSSGREDRRHGVGMSGFLGAQFASWPHGRSVDPYFYAAITATGSRIPATGSVPPIRFKPGEVRVFAPTSPIPSRFQKPNYGSNYNATVPITGITAYLRPVDDISQFSTKGGLEAQISTTQVQQGESAEIHFRIASGEDYPLFISVEDATRAKGPTATNKTRGQAWLDVIQRRYGQTGEFGQRGSGFRSVRQTWQSLREKPAPFAVLEFYHRYARTGNEQAGDLLFTQNPRQPWMSQYMSNANVHSGPQYQLRVRGPITSFNDLFETGQGSGGRTALYGPSNSISSDPPGRSQLSFFEVPQAPLLSLAAFQHVDLSSTPFGPANQFANSWASAYVPRNRSSIAATGIGENARPPIYDTPYLVNEALWDGFFFSGAAPTVGPGAATGSPAVWDAPVANIGRGLPDVVRDFVRDPLNNPLRNPRMRLEKGDVPEDELVRELLQPQGCLKIAGHLMVDGAFNVNSTSVEAWTAVLAGLRGESFNVTDGASPGSSATAFPRLRNPIGTENDHWHGFRSLSDNQVRTLATNLVDEVRSRGPFLSLAEFVNRRVSADPKGLKGPLQAAIDNSSLNEEALYDPFSLTTYPAQSRQNVSPNRTGVGIPGYLTQADVLHSIAPILTVRSDTFTVRGYGEARDAAGKVTATAWCEAIVQRTPGFVDSTDAPYTAIEDTSKINRTFGRRFSIVSFRYLSPSELRI